MGNPDRADGCPIEIKPSDVCAKMLGRSEAQTNYLLRAGQPAGLEVPVPAARLMDRVPRREATVSDAANARGPGRVWGLRLPGQGCLAQASCHGGLRRGPGCGSWHVHSVPFLPGSSGRQAELRSDQPTPVWTSVVDLEETASRSGLEPCQASSNAGWGLVGRLFRGCLAHSVPLGQHGRHWQAQDYCPYRVQGRHH